ncbi:MAG: DUF4159 domain-containing protein [Planctomycetota bacterium]
MVRMREWLYAQQDPATGSWDDPHWPELRRQGYHATAETAMVAYALLASGESYQDPRLAKAIDFLKAREAESTYVAAIRAHLWAALPDGFLPLLNREAAYLKKAHRGGRFYYHHDSPTWSNSLTQYGVLGLWEYQKRGGRVDPETWRAVAEHLLESQNADGGWSYNHTKLRGGGASTTSMTAAGAVMLQIVQQQLAAEALPGDPRLADALARGARWLDQHFDPARNVGYGDGDRFRYYTLYGIERFALAGGVSRLAGRDWFSDGARFILDEEAGQGSLRPHRNDDTSRRIDTAFALLFLARGRVPIWASKLIVPDRLVGARPYDLHALTRYLSDQREAELNWQAVSFDGDPLHWLRAPVLLLSLPGPIKLSGLEKAKLKRYLDAGGQVFINPEGPRSGVARWAEGLARELYPRLEFRNVDRRHDLASLVIDLAGPDGRVTPRLKTLNNGVRDLMVLARIDLGAALLGDARRGRGRAEAWGYFTNLYAAATGRGQRGSRLQHPWRSARPNDPQVLPAAETPPITVARVVRAGQHDLEPLALEAVGLELHRRTGRALRVVVRTLTEIDRPLDDGGLPALVHLAGVDATQLSDEEAAALIRYIDRGGKVLVETVGGRGGFADGLSIQLSEALGRPRYWLIDPHPVVTGQGLPGGRDAREVVYRRYTQATAPPGTAPLIGALDRDGVPAILFSTYDLSLGGLGCRTYGINGYRFDSARALWVNILLWAAR